MKKNKPQTATLDVISIARLACSMQASIPRVRTAINELGIPVAFRQNGIDHYEATVADQLFPVLARTGTKP